MTEIHVTAFTISYCWTDDDDDDDDDDDYDDDNDNDEDNGDDDYYDDNDDDYDDDTDSDEDNGGDDDDDDDNDEDVYIFASRYKCISYSTADTMRYYYKHQPVNVLQSNNCDYYAHSQNSEKPILATSYPPPCLPTRPSNRPHETTLSPLDRFSWNSTHFLKHL
jgi:hypothetical protein